MARSNLSSWTRGVLTDISERMAPRPVRFVVLGLGLAVTFVLHLGLADSRIAWAAVPFALLAGLAGGVRSPLIVAGIAAGGHLAVDLVLGLDTNEVLGVVIRSLVLPGVALVGMADQQSERQRAQALVRAYNEDPVTGLLSVRSFYDELARLRATGRGFAILLADIRGTRTLNERYGHPTGTEAMRVFAHALRRTTGPHACASRLGSDEIAVTLVGEDRDRGRAIVDEIIARLHDEQIALPDGQRFEVHASYGVAQFPEHGNDEVAVLLAADRAKQRAKAAGLDRVGFGDDVAPGP